MATITGVRHAVLAVRDPQRSITFYTETLGMELVTFLEATNRCSGMGVPQARRSVAAGGDDPIAVAREVSREHRVLVAAQDGRMEDLSFLVASHVP